MVQVKIPLIIEKSDRVTLATVVKCPKLGILTSVKFIVDTGSQLTFLGMDDVARQNRLLQHLIVKEKVLMGGGKINILEIPHPTTIVLIDESQKLQNLELPNFAVSDQASSKHVPMKISPSILGLDFLRQHDFDLFISTKDNKAYLEKL